MNCLNQSCCIKSECHQLFSNRNFHEWVSDLWPFFAIIIFGLNSVNLFWKCWSILLVLLDNWEWLLLFTVFDLVYTESVDNWAHDADRKPLSGNLCCVRCSALKRRMKIVSVSWPAEKGHQLWYAIDLIVTITIIKISVFNMSPNLLSTLNNWSSVTFWFSYWLIYLNMFSNLTSLCFECFLLLQEWRFSWANRACLVGVWYVNW